MEQLITEALRKSEKEIEGYIYKKGLDRDYYISFESDGIFLAPKGRSSSLVIIQDAEMIRSELSIEVETPYGGKAIHIFTKVDMGRHQGIVPY